MKALPARDHQELVGPLTGQPVLTREFNRAFGHFRATIEKRHMVQIARRDLGDSLGKLGHPRRLEL